MQLKYTPLEQNVLDLFNRTELRPHEDVVDNRDSTIAKELNMTVAVVCRIITMYLDRKRDIINLYAGSYGD